MDFDIIIIGVGVVGLAVGRALINETDKICLIEKK
jgi:L-2-hydroxyglutarate oxidase LhgO